jgi:hypothetical protein
MMCGDHNPYTEGATPMVFNTAQLISMALGVVIPLINGLVTKYGAASARVYLQIILSAVAGFLTEWISALDAGQAINWTQFAMGWIATLVTALSVEAKIWAPLGVSDKLKRVGSSAPTAVK